MITNRLFRLWLFKCLKTKIYKNVYSDISWLRQSRFRVPSSTVQHCSLDEYKKLADVTSFSGTHENTERTVLKVFYKRNSKFGPYIPCHHSKKLLRLACVSRYCVLYVLCPYTLSERKYTHTRVDNGTITEKTHVASILQYFWNEFQSLKSMHFFDIFKWTVKW